MTSIQNTVKTLNPQFLSPSRSTKQRESEQINLNAACGRGARLCVPPGNTAAAGQNWPGRSPLQDKGLLTELPGNGEGLVRKQAAAWFWTNIWNFTVWNATQGGLGPCSFTSSLLGSKNVMINPISPDFLENEPGKPSC